MPQSPMQQPPNETLKAWDRQYVWHPFTQMEEYEPLILQRGEGCRVVDIDGGNSSIG
jgi:adenosylmethionine-8-amino-7-oxononanoate aminotransferase